MSATTTAPRPGSNHVGDRMLIGFADRRGGHFDNTGSNTYPGPVPLEAAESLLDWTPVEGTVESFLPDGQMISDLTRKTIVHPRSHAVFGVFKQGYTPHPYRETLLDRAALIVDDELHIAQVGELKHGARAFVQYEMPNNREVEGVEYRPYFTTATSLDGSLSTTFQTGSTLIICTNMVSATLGNKRNHLVQKIRHSRHSLGTVIGTRYALGMISQVADAFEEELKELIATPVTPKDWTRFLDLYVPVKDKDGQPKEGRSLTTATNKRESLSELWKRDPMVHPFAGTGFGVVQAVNTWAAHKQGGLPQGTTRHERNIDRAILGQTEELDASARETLQLVLAQH